MIGDKIEELEARLAAEQRETQERLDREYFSPGSLDVHRRVREQKAAEQERKTDEKRAQLARARRV